MTLIYFDNRMFFFAELAMFQRDARCELVALN